MDILAVCCLGKKLPQSIVDIERGVGYGSTVNRICFYDRCNSLFCIIAVREGGAIGKNDLADELSGSRGFNLCFFLMLRSYLTGVINELSGNEVGSKLELIEFFTAEGVGLGVPGYIATTCRELHNGVIVVCLVVDGLGSAADGVINFLVILSSVS